MNQTAIEWTDVTWNPTRGCSRVSQGCFRCYAEVEANIHEWKDKEHTKPGPFHGFIHKVNGRPAWTGKVDLIESKLTEPLSWKKPKRIFVNSMSDLWHEKLPLRDVARVYAVMRLAHWHQFQVLTKRPDVRLAAFKSREFWRLVELAEEAIAIECEIVSRLEAEIPTPWIWEGVSVEDQPTADKRIPLLLQTPAAVRFVSYEPALGPVDFRKFLFSGVGSGRLNLLHWVICGGESGPDARPMAPDWARSVRDQCISAGVPFFFKQWGEWAPYRNSEANKYLDVPVGDGTHHRMFKVGKKAAGRLLDGRTWDEFPK